MFGSAGKLIDLQVPQITRHEKDIYLAIPVKLVFFVEVDSKNSIKFFLC